MKLSKIIKIFALLLCLSPLQALASCQVYAPDNAYCTTQGEAFAFATDRAWHLAKCKESRPTTDDVIITPSLQGTRYYVGGQCKTLGTLNNSITSRTANYGGTCLAQPAAPFPYQEGIGNGALTCLGGCQFSYAASGNPPVGAVAPTGAVCNTYSTANPCPSGYVTSGGLGGFCVPPPPPDADGDGVPDADDAFPNDPNESEDSDGDGVGDNGDIMPDDPTNGADEDEEGGDEGDNRSTGGGNCKTPPSSTGDAILAQIAYQAWSTRCAAEGLGGKVTGDPTVCAGTYSCTGDQVQCAQVALMKKTACANQTATGDANGNGQPDWTEVGDGGVSGNGDQDAGLFNRLISGGMNAIDQGGVLSNRSCPTLGTITLPSNLGTFSFDSEPWFCDLLAMIKAAMTLMGTFIAMRILLGDRG